MEYDWLGTRENLIERMVILSNNEMITLEDLPEKIRTLLETDQPRRIDIPEGGVSLETAVSDFEKQLILQALNKTGWVKNKAAQLLHLNRTTLIEKIKRQNLQRQDS
jgi:DNA-binding NtrC family response regulator